MTHELYAVFSKVIYINYLNDITNEQLHEIKNYLSTLEYERANPVDLSTNSSKSFQVLENKKLFFLKQKLIQEFNLFKNNVLKYENNDFVFTTSWVAKSLKNQTSEWHRHDNCMYSGIFYVNTDENCGNLLFENFYDTKRFTLRTTEDNFYNSKSFFVAPKNKMLIFFPSEIYHKILKNNSNIERYSIAFNLMPIGNIGNSDGDSFLKLGEQND